jgi:proline iminopeptidase
VRVDIGGVRLFVDVIGPHFASERDEMRERPVLLVLHGGPGADHSGCRPYFDRFSDTHCVVYYDQRGHGRSDERDDPSGWTLDTWADDVWRLCDALGVDHPVLLGISFGGVVAAHAAGRQPDRAAKLVLVSRFARRDDEAMLRAFERRGGARAREVAARFWTSADESKLAEYGEVCLPLYLRHPPANAGPSRSMGNIAVMFHFVAHVRPDLDVMPSVAAINCPAMVLVGEDDPVCPPAMSDAIVATLPADLVRFECLADGGHGTQFDQPEATEAVLRSFL